MSHWAPCWEQSMMRQLIISAFFSELTTGLFSLAVGVELSSYLRVALSLMFCDARKLENVSMNESRRQEWPAAAASLRVSVHPVPVL
jgi:hypothetical protein